MSGIECRRPEHALLLAGARVALGTADATRFEEALSQDIDWAFCTREAVRHGVVSLLCDALDRADTAETEGIPADVRDRFDEYHRDTVRRTHHLTGKLVRIVDRFNEAGVDVRPFKGPVLAVKAYGDLTARPFVDLDLLVRPDAFQEAKQVLREAGYRERSAQTPTHEKVNRQFRNNTIFLDGKTQIELHHRVLPPRFGRGIPVDRLFERARTVDVAGTTVQTAPPAETLLIAVVHGTKHLWERLEWLCAVVGLLDRAAIDWERVYAEADAVRKTRMLAVTLCLAHDVLGAPLPQQIRDSIDGDMRAQGLYNQLTRTLFDPPNATAIRKLSLQARTLDGVGNRTRFWAEFCFGPSPADVDFLTLPSWLTRGYHLVRPFRLALAVGQLGVKRLTEGLSTD